MLAIWPAALALYFAWMLWNGVTVQASLSWSVTLGLTLSFYADGLALLFGVLIAGIGALIIVFSSRYFDGHPHAGRFYAILFGFMGSMLGIVLGGDLLTLFVFWELTGFTSFLLIGFDHERTEARSAGVQALIVTGTGGMALLAAAVLVQQATGTFSLAALLGGDVSLRSAGAYPGIVILVLLAAFTKSAQAPFHFWLPNAMAAPTPVSAYLHSATMVKAGVYLVARMTPLLGDTPLWNISVTAVGATTMALGAWRAVSESDLKRVLAYSTVSALGVLMMLLGTGTAGAVTAALVYLAAHACYKGALFLVAGTLEHETGTRLVTELGGLRRSLPVLAAAGALAALSMAGVPFFLGFVGKELLYGALFDDSAQWGTVLLVGTIVASALLGAAGLLAGVSPFFGRAGKAAVEHGAAIALVLPPLLLAVFGVFAGFWPAVLDVPIGAAAASVIREPPAVHLSLWHGLTPVLGLSLLTLALAAAIYYARDIIRRRIWPRSLGFERIYSVPIRALDALSAWSMPALQGATLSSYVLTLVTTAGLLLVVVLVSMGLPEWPSVIAAQPHEAAAVLLIIGGAVTAVRARSPIFAVLSLSISGYGVALTFLFFGAPDLAITQFSVETLTAVIFVMVFYHFRALGPLSSLRVRARDSLVAILFGGAIAIVLFFVGAAVTPWRLSAYFAANSLPLAHGRNIVNVILVDFRALDTLGEITVLATAALGVRALMRMGRGKDER
jgi:multicomponent Na+:H+ antiporter subunit A